MSQPTFETIYRALIAGERSSSSRPFRSLLGHSAPGATTETAQQSYLHALIAGENASSPFKLFQSLAPAPTPFKSLVMQPRVFVSYHHELDRPYYDEFTRRFADEYDICYDNSVSREIFSDDADYVMRRIRENYLTGTSCTVVLCGAETRWRKFVDWEIKATLDKQHGLIGVNLPTNPRDAFGRVHVPDRLQENVGSRFALWFEWDVLIAGGPNLLKFWLQVARSAPSSLIRNDRPLRRRNG